MGGTAAKIFTNVLPGVGNGNPLHYSCLKNSMDRGAWGARGLQSMGWQMVGHDPATEHTHTTFYCPGLK